jgi:hypothetical protein
MSRRIQSGAFCLIVGALATFCGQWLVGGTMPGLDNWQSLLVGVLAGVTAFKSIKQQ